MRLRVGDRIEKFIYSKSNQDRLDIFLTTCLPEFSRARIQKLIKDGFVSINNITITKGGRNLEGGENIEIIIPPRIPSTLVAEDIPLEIIFENNDLVVVNKPAGMVVHPSPGHNNGTLVHAALGHIPDLEGIGGEERPGIVHRLDKDTSGLIVIAKNERAHHWLQEQFKSRQVEKKYIALVDGKPPTPTGRVEAPIGRNTTHRKLMGVVSNEKGREAITEYSTLENFPEHTLLEVHPKTGRTHQIRVHLAFLGCPVAADMVYGKRKPTVELNRHFLHASRLKIIIPGEERARIFEAPLPHELHLVVEQLRNRKE
jgi:23S rRNA pseudouridine1911/1915/1917 synthase